MMSHRRCKFKTSRIRYNLKLLLQLMYLTLQSLVPISYSLKNSSCLSILKAQVSLSSIKFLLSLHHWTTRALKTESRREDQILTITETRNQSLNTTFRYMTLISSSSLECFSIQNSLFATTLLLLMMRLEWSTTWRDMSGDFQEPKTSMHNVLSEMNTNACAT